MRQRIDAFFVCCLPLYCAAQQKTEITSDRVNAALTQLDPYIRSTLDKTKVPGAAVAVIYNDQVVFLRGYGVRKVGEPETIDPDTVFEIAVAATNRENRPEIIITLLNRRCRLLNLQISPIYWLAHSAE